MEKQNIQLIAIDLDGTLIDQNKKIPDDNIAALREAAARGIYVVLCSGRGHGHIVQRSRQIGVNHPVISANGALIRMGWEGETLGESCLPRDMAYMTLEETVKADGGYMVFAYDSLWVNRIHDGFDTLPQWQKALEEEHTRLYYDLTPGEIMDRLGDKAHKIVVFEPDPRSTALRKRMETLLPQAEITTSLAGLFEVNAPGISKGFGIERLCRHLGISPENAMALGDHENDESMFHVVGCPVAMGNAQSALKEKAKYITLTNNEAGVGYAVRKWALGE